MKVTAQNHDDVSALLTVTLEKSDFDYIDINADYNRTDEMEEQLRQVLNPEFKYVVKRE